MSHLSKNETALHAQMRADKGELRQRIESDPRLKKDFEFLIEKTRLRPDQLITGLWLDCNLMHADQQTLLRNEKMEMWPIPEDELRRNIKSFRRIAGQIRAINRSKNLSPTVTKNAGESISNLESKGMLE